MPDALSAPKMTTAPIQAMLGMPPLATPQRYEVINALISKGALRRVSTGHHGRRAVFEIPHLAPAADADTVTGTAPAPRPTPAPQRFQERRTLHHQPRVGVLRTPGRARRVRKGPPLLKLTPAPK